MLTQKTVLALAKEKMPRSIFGQMTEWNVYGGKPAVSGNYLLDQRILVKEFSEVVGDHKKGDKSAILTSPYNNCTQPGI